MDERGRGGEIGRREGLKIPWEQSHPGSSPGPGISGISRLAWKPQWLRTPMAIREFTDALGHGWLVWEVQPRSIERRLATNPAVVAVVGERRRRSTGEARVHASSPLAKGWLAFESRNERRRLAPIPPAWSSLADADLSALLERATPTHRARRLIE